jgi:hypothetical protein
MAIRPDNLLVLTKFGQREHMTALIDGGLVYLNTIKYHTQSDAAHPSYDDWEGSTDIWQEDKVRVTVTSDSEEFNIEFSGPLRFYNPDKDRYRATHAYCMCGLTNRDIRWRRRIFHPRMIEFGNTAVVVHNVPEFKSRIRRALAGLPPPQACLVAAGSVRYISDMHHGEYSLLQKRQRYDWQREYRFLICSEDESQPLTVTLGPLHDIAVMVPMDIMQNKIVRSSDGINIWLS